MQMNDRVTVTVTESHSGGRFRPTVSFDAMRWHFAKGQVFSGRVESINDDGTLCLSVTTDGGLTDFVFLNGGCWE